MEKLPVWDPYKDWRHIDIDWIKVDISKDDLKRFIKRSDLKGLLQTISFLFIIGLTASLSYYAYSIQNWILMAVGLYFHGMIYGHFTAAIHELIHNTVFASKFLSKSVRTIYGLLYWPLNPYLYRLSHVHFHHRYTLHRNSDGEDTSNYVEINIKSLSNLFFKVLDIKDFFNCLGRLFTLKPTSKGFRLAGYNFDNWERFILEKATEKEVKEVHRFSILSLIFVVAFVTACIISGYWFLIILITLAPFYGPPIHVFMCGIHQHACCKTDNPDFRKICADAILDPISSTLFWHMEYHIEHHMFASIPCYNLKKFSKFIADQLPEREFAIPRIAKLSKRSREMFGSRKAWREKYGRYKGV